MTKKINFAFLMLLFIAAVSGCKKDDKYYPKEIVSFSFTEKDEQGAVKEYPGTIIGDEIVVDLPTEVDVTNIVPQFEVVNPRTIVQVGKVVQESGISVMDFTEPVTYMVRAEDKSTKSYNVRFEKKVGIKSYGFYMEDNPSNLKSDYIGKLKGLKIEIGVPESIDFTQLVARFETTDGITLKVGGVDQESKVSKNNFTGEVVYSLTGPGITTPLTIIAKTFVLGAKWILIGDDKITGSTGANDLRMAINPITNLPYIAYQRNGSDENSVVIPDANKKVAVIRYTVDGWQHLGDKTGVSDSEASDSFISFDQAGTPYIAFLEDATSKSTVLKYVNSAWTAVGSKSFSLVKATSQSFIVSTNNVPMVSILSNSSDVPGYPRRALFVTHFENQWLNYSPPGISIAAHDLFNGMDGKTYLALMDRTTGSNRLTMLKLNGNSWIPMGPTSFTTADNALGYTTAFGTADKEGQVYIIFQQNVSSIRRNRILKFNGATWDELPMPETSEGKTGMYRLAVHPDGTLFYAFANNSGLYFQTFNKVTNNWNARRLIYAGSVYELDMKISNTGIPYLVLNDTNDNTFVYKYTTE